MSAKKVYFLSDAHLGSRAVSDSRGQERRLVRFLDSIRHEAAAIYLLGDMFDFWFEYRTVVPKGCTRFIGKIAELCDNGVEVHYFTGNHDLWMDGYLEAECGLTLHRADATVDIMGRRFYLSHGDGLDPTDRKFALLRRVFHNRLCRRLFALLHPRWGVDFGLAWAAHSRRKRKDGQEPPYRGEANESLVRFAKAHARTHADIDFYIFGHRHIALDLMLSRSTRMLILGDWITQYSYAVFDGERLVLDSFDEPPV